MKIGTGYCNVCKKQVRLMKKGTNHWLHLILTILTGGLWIIIWLFSAITWDDWYCVYCGKHIKLNSSLQEGTKD